MALIRDIGRRPASRAHYAVGLWRSAATWERRVLVYRPGGPAALCTELGFAGDGPVAGFVLDLAEVWSCCEV